MGPFVLWYIAGIFVYILLVLGHCIEQNRRKIWILGMFLLSSLFILYRDFFLMILRESQKELVI